MNSFPKIIKTYIFTPNSFHRKSLFKLLPVSFNKPFKALGPAFEIPRKLIWQGSLGHMDSVKINGATYPSAPLELSEYLLLRTKEKMVLEA